MEKSNNAESSFLELIEKRNNKIIDSNLDEIKKTITEICGRDGAPRLTLDFALVSTTHEITTFHVVVDINTKLYNSELPY